MKRAAALTLTLALLVSLCCCESAGESAVEAEVLAIRAENEAKAESLREAGSPSPGSAAEAGSPVTEADAGLPAPAGGAEADGLAKRPPKTDWEGILSSQYQLVGNKYYFRMKFWLTRQVEHGTKSGTAALYHWLDLATGDWGVVCPDPLCRHDDPAVCKYLEKGFLSPHTFLDENTFLSNYDVTPMKPQLCLFDLKDNTMKPLFKGNNLTGVDVLGADGNTVWLCRAVEKTVKKQTTLTRTLYKISLPDGAVLYERVLPENCRPFLWHDGLLYCDNVKSITVADPETWEETVLLEYAAADYIGEWYLDTNRDEFWFDIKNKDKMTGRIYRYSRAYSRADGVCEEVPMPVPEIYYFQLTNSMIYYSPYDPVELGTGRWGDKVYDYAGKTIWAVSRDDTAGEPAAVYEEKENRILASNAAGYLIFGSTLLFDTMQVEKKILYDEHLQPIGEYTEINYAGDVHKICVDLRTGEEDAITFD